MRRLLLLLVIVLVNLPAAHQQWTDHRIAGRGEDVRAEVVDLRSEGGGNLVDYRLPEEIDPRRTLYSASVDDRAYARARDTRELDVRVLPGSPGANRPDGEVENPLLLVVAIGADLILVVVLLLMRHRRRRRAENGPDLYDHA